MINLKVKTLDSQNHDFSVDDEITVRQFKEHISEKVNVSADLQRLIYCGRVLNDEKPLKEYDVNGKVVHLVQRPPPSANSTNSNDSPSARRNIRSGPINVGDFENMMMGSFTIPVNIGSASAAVPSTTHNAVSVSSTLCMNRITVAKHMLKCAENIAAYLEDPSVGLNNTAMDLLSQQTMESTVFEVGISAVTSDIPQHQVQNIVQAFQGAVSAAFRQNGISNITVQHSDSMPGIQVFGTAPAGASGPSSSSTTSISIPINLSDLSNLQESASAPPAASNTPPNEATNASTAPPPGNSAGPRQQTTNTQVLAEVVQHMRTVQQRLEPFVQQYHKILQDDPQYADDDTAARENAQRVFDRVSEALHYMSHAQHAISDLMLDLSSNTPRHLCCRPILVEQSAFVRSGISAVPQLNIGSFMRGSNNNNNNNININNNNNVDPSGDSGFSIHVSDQSGTAAAAAAAAAQEASPQSADDAANDRQGQLSSSPISRLLIPIPNRSRRIIIRRSASNRERVERFLQSIVNSVQPNTEVHIINANLSAPSPPPAAASTTAATPTTTSTRTAAAPTMSDPSRAQSGTRTVPLTLPTTSTQTRSTSRPQILTSTTLPPTSIRNLRPISSNVLSSFDRFLPCNSHHIRENNQQQQQQSTQTTAPVQVPRSTQRRSVSLDRSAQHRLGNFMTSTISSSSSKTFNGLNNITDDEYNHRFNLFGIQFTLRDLDNISPSYFNGMRTELRSNLERSYYGGAAVTQDNLESGVNKMMNDLEKYINRLSKFAHPDYNICGSVEKLIKKTLPSLISLINEDSSSEFGKRFERQLMTFFENIYMVLVKCIGIQNTELYLNDVIQCGVSGGQKDHAGRFNRFSRYLIQTYLINRRSYDLSEIQEFLVTKPRDDLELPMDVDGEESAAVELEVEIETTSEPEKIDNEILMETKEESAVDANVQANDLMEDPLPIVVEGSESWHSHFPSDWLSIISRDIVRQMNQSAQRQFSDAYISGMSAKRRKLYFTKKAVSSPQQLLNDGIRQAVQSFRQPVASSSRSTATRSLADNVPFDEILASVSADPQLQQQYRDTIRSTINERLSQDADYSSEKFPNCKKMSQH